MTKLPLGDLLVRSGVLTRETLNRALYLQEEMPEKRLGDILIEMGAVSTEQIANVVGQQLGIPYMDLSDIAPDPVLVQSIPMDLLIEHQVVPLRKEKERILLAMADPLDVVAQDEISMATNSGVIPVLSPAEQISGILERLKKEPLPAQAAEEKEPEEAKKAEQELILLSSPMAAEKSVKLLETLILRAYRLKAADFHIAPRETDARVRYRLNGMTYDMTILKQEAYEDVLSQLTELLKWKPHDMNSPLEGKFVGEIQGTSVNLGVSTFPTASGTRLAFRLLNLPEGMQDVKSRGMANEQMEELNELLERPSGLLLFAGIPGSGRNSTLNTCLQTLAGPERIIFALESQRRVPVKGISYLSLSALQSENTWDTLSAILSQLPDVLAIGEVSNKAKAVLALDASLSGCLVLGTIYAQDCVSAIMRLLHLDVEPRLLCSTLSGVVAQKLLRLLCPRCKTPYLPDSDELQKIGAPPGNASKGLTLYNPKGCRECFHTGYSGRTGLFEVLKMKDGIREQILKGSPAQSILVHAEHSGMVTMKARGLRLVREGLTSERELFRVVPRD